MILVYAAPSSVATVELRSGWCWWKSRLASGVCVVVKSMDYFPIKGDSHSSINSFCSLYPLHGKYSNTLWEWRRMDRHSTNTNIFFFRFGTTSSKVFSWLIDKDVVHDKCCETFYSFPPIDQTLESRTVADLRLEQVRLKVPRWMGSSC